jgi:hypothetical protein
MTYRYKEQINSRTKKGRWMIQFRFLYLFWIDLPRSTPKYEDVGKCQMDELINELNDNGNRRWVDQ